MNILKRIIIPVAVSALFLTSCDDDSCQVALSSDNTSKATTSVESVPTLKVAELKKNITRLSDGMNRLKKSNDVFTSDMALLSSEIDSLNELLVLCAQTTDVATMTSAPVVSIAPVSICKSASDCTVATNGRSCFSLATLCFFLGFVVVFVYIITRGRKRDK